jgi:perosamine synthetase
MGKWVTENISTGKAESIFEDQAGLAVKDAFRQDDLGHRDLVKDLEKDYCGYFDRKYALSHNSSASAFMSAFYALDLMPGDEVLVPTAAPWSCVAPMIWNGLLPIFCDSEVETLGISPEDMRCKISHRTRAVVIVHLFGVPCNYTEIKKICQEYGLVLVEDASHAMGAIVEDGKCGSLGDISIIDLESGSYGSFGEGAIILTDIYEYWENAVCSGDTSRISDLKTDQFRFAATSMGLRTSINPVSAALGRECLKNLPDRVMRISCPNRLLSLRLAEMDFDCFIPKEGSVRNYFKFIIRHNDEMFDCERFVQLLQEHGCSVSSPDYSLLHSQPLFNEDTILRIGRFPVGTKVPDYAGQSFPVTDKERRRLIELPDFTDQSQSLIDEYVVAFSKALALMSK